MEELRPQLAQIDADNKAILADRGMTITEYEPEFFENVLNLDSVKALYSDINEQSSF